MDTHTLENRITGLQAKLSELRVTENLFHKVKGLEEESEKAKKEISELEIDLQVVKEDLAELRAGKAVALQATAEAMSERMNLVLPGGKATFEIAEDGSVQCRWGEVPYAGLSGGQKAVFDQALSFALLGDGHKVLVMEAAELDQVHLESALKHLTGLPEDTQVIVSTCHAPTEVPEGWNVVEVS